MDISLFVNMTSRAWSLPILARLHDGVPGRQAPLLAATGASRTAFAQSMEHLIQIGLLERNPGHGHPLRPEFRLTQIGIRAAALAHKINRITQDEDTALLRRSWTLPVLAALYEPRHFNDIRRGLGRITDRALSQSLRAMEDRCWVSRRINDAARPPRALYTAINTGQLISQAAAVDIRFNA
ncbi:winged helix-turn-helix transcriptional regulator [Yoonia sp. BS5-3]|uniref:Winged helix-turn-helix transcriptional regulator n=1 Tax=Yoonia phaeophyticola TaxID=3137369 RepID=A0ABZ2V7L7_9RHOB